MTRFLGKLLLVIPYFYLCYILIHNKSYPVTTIEFYFFAFVLLGFLGLLSISLNINKNLGIIYVLISFILYFYFYDNNIFNLWPIGGLILLIKDNKIPVKKLNIRSWLPDIKLIKLPDINKIKLIKFPVVMMRILLEDINKIKKRSKKPDIEDYWVRYDNRMRGRFKLREKLIKKISFIFSGNF